MQICVKNISISKINIYFFYDNNIFWKCMEIDPVVHIFFEVDVIYVQRTCFANCTKFSQNFLVLLDDFPEYLNWSLVT